MARKSLLLVDADPRSLRVLEVSLRKAGYNLATCGDVKTALETVEYSPPDLIVLDTRLPGPSGFELVESLRKNPDWATIPMIFLSSDTSVESKVRGLQLGVEDYLTKPIYIKEIVARINLTLARVERESVARRSSISKTRFSGSLTDMGLVDLLQTIDISRKSGVLELRSTQRSGMITFRDGQVLDAELGSFFGERAIYRLLLWNEGEFEIDFRPVRVEQRVQIPTQGLLMEGMRRLDEWGRTCEQIPPLQSVLEVQAAELTSRLAELPDEINGILKLFDGQRSIQDVVDSVQADDLSTLSAISKLYFEGIVQPTGRIRTLRPPELLAGGAEGDVNEVVPVTTSSGEHDSPRTDERALSDEDRMTVPGHASVVPPPMNPGSIVPPPALAALSAELSAELSSADAPAASPGGGPSSSEASLAVGQPGTGTTPAMGGDTGSPRAESAKGNGATATPPYGNPPPRGRLPQTTLLGPGFDQTSAALASAAPTPTESRSGEPSPSTQESRDEDVMSKKKRRNRGGNEDQRERKVESAPEVAKRDERREEAQKSEARAKEDESNVIQFPAKRSVTAIAVNDDVESASVSSSTRDDDTSSRRRDDEKRREEEKAKKPLPGELPRVRDEDEDDDGLPKEVAAAPPDNRERRDERRKKKNATTSSGEIRALGGTGEHGVAAEEFFRPRQRSSAPPEDHDDFSDLKSAAEPIPVASLQWRNATIGIVLFFGTIIGGYWYYTNVHLPQPVELGHARPTVPVVPASSGAGEEPEAREPAVAAAEPAAVEPAAVVEPTAVEPTAVEAIEPGAEVAVAEPAVEPTVEAVPEPVVEPAVIEPAAAPLAGESYASVLAEADAARRRPATAIPLYERAIELNPNGTEALSQLAYLLINRGRGDDTRRAAAFAERATSADSTDSLAWLVLAVARETLGDRTGARAAYRACVDQGAPGRWQQQCRPHAR